MNALQIKKLKQLNIPSDGFELASNSDYHNSYYREIVYNDGYVEYLLVMEDGSLKATSRAQTIVKASDKRFKKMYKKHFLLNNFQ